jgi:hypothetical protein
VTHPVNHGVLKYFCPELEGSEAWLSPASSLGNSSHRSGSHPEIVEYLWDSLAPGLPVDCRALVCGRPSLVAPRRKVIFAVPLGTEYGLRLPPAQFALARAAGAEVVHHYTTVGVTLNLAERFGPNWVFGVFDRREPEWCVAALEFAEAA